MNFAEIIQIWFDKELGGGLILPDGWYGRPYDNQHALSAVQEIDKTLIVMLDKKLTLNFYNLKAVEATKNGLVFGPFEKLCFHWESYGSGGQSGDKEYESGEVQIVVPPGRTL